MLGHKIEREHFHELALGGLDEISNMFFSHKRCHDIITRGSGATTAGSSVGRIAKAKRLEAKRLGKVKIKRKIPSRPLRRSVTPS